MHVGVPPATTNNDEISKPRGVWRKGDASQTVPPGYLAATGSKYPSPGYLRLSTGDTAGMWYLWDKYGPQKKMTIRNLMFTGPCIVLTHCGRVTQICIFNMVKLGTSASSL